MAIWNRITAFVTGGAVATAAADAIKPEYEPLQQTAWKNAPYKVLDPRIVAAIRARETTADVPGINRGNIDLEDDAARGGVGSARGDILVELEREYPGLGELTRLRRRYIGTNGKEGIPPETFRAALRRQGMPAPYITALEELFSERLDPGQIAAGIHRGLIPDPGLLKGEQPEPPFTVEAYPVYPIDALAEAEANGYDHDRLGVLVGLQGLPMGVIEAAQSYYRGLITKGDYIRAFNESNNRNEWAEAVLKYAAQIPTARDFIENALRGYRTLEQAQEGAALHGMSPDHARLIFQNSGRPLNLHQITQALAWGATYNPLPGDNPDPYMNSVLIGSVTPAYYEMQDALKYNLPSALYFRTLQTSGVLTPDEAFTWYKRLGWPPDLARQVADAFGKAAPAAPDKLSPAVKSAQTRFITAIHKAFVGGAITEDQMVLELQLSELSTADQAGVADFFKKERDLQLIPPPPPQAP